MDLAWPLTDDRLSIRPATVEDAEAVFDYQRLPECQRYVGYTVESLDQTRDFLAQRTAGPDDLVCAIELGGEVVGDIGGRLFQPLALGGAEHDAWDFFLGYSVHPRLWGQGIATSAVALMVPALHERGGIRRIVAKVFADNAPSLTVLTRNGFRLEGTERAAVLGRDGRWLDDCTLAHLAGE